MRRIATWLAAVLLLALSSGCAVTRATAQVDPATQLDKLKVLHVKKLADDERGIDVLIADKLRSRGFSVTTDNQTAPKKIDALVTYVDRWFWDITMYMLELTVTVRDPQTDYPLATGNSYRTSLARKSPPEMVDEVVSNILKEGNYK